MKPETLEALKASIEHWRQNENSQTPNSASVSAGDCALCKVFGWACQTEYGEKCPVYASTSQQRCNGSPYYAARRAFYYWHRLHATESGAYFREAFRAAARKEREFLESLLPQE